MKVLFAVKDDKVSEAIVKKYQEKYQEIISYKNVYYFNAIYKELQKEKSYDRIVINEDLEPFANNNYDNIDKFLFDKLDNISDEATNIQGNDIEIILVCLDRRNKTDDMLLKYFGIGVYNALIGKDRSLDEVCKLIHQPRNKKDAKQYYKIDSDNVNYKAENENSVSEAEMQNIIAHYKRLGKNEDKYVDSFNNIITQYNDEQLKIVIRYLPNHVKAVLREESPKYQQLTNYVPPVSNKNKEQNSLLNKELALSQKQMEEKLQGKKILIPKEVDTSKQEKIYTEQKENFIENIEIPEVQIPEEQKTEEPKRGRGRPRKTVGEEVQEEKPKRGRGRPKKVQEEMQQEELQQETEDLDLFSLLDESEDTITQDELVEQQEETFDIDLFSLDQEDTDNTVLNEVTIDELNEVEQTNDVNVEEELDLFAMSESQEETTKEQVKEEPVSNFDFTEMQEAQTTAKYNLNRLLTADKKVTCFVGTTKNGTSFIVNNCAEILSNMGISTAILDMTKNRNSYYIYTQGNEDLRKIAASSLKKLNVGVAEGIQINKNLTVYSGMPNEYNDMDIYQMLATLVENHSVVLVDCDFDTPIEIFKESQEIYLVQTLDVLTIQPLTAFLRDIKAKGALEENKIKIVINKDEKVRGLSDKRLIGGMANYNEPSMSFMTELFNKDNVPYVKIPFDIKNYVLYLEGLVDCEIKTRGYTKQFINALQKLVGMIYPLINSKKYQPPVQNHFTNEVNDTLEKMKNNY